MKFNKFTGRIATTVSFSFLLFFSLLLVSCSTSQQVENTQSIPKPIEEATFNALNNDLTEMSATFIASNNIHQSRLPRWLRIFVSDVLGFFGPRNGHWRLYNAIAASESTALDKDISININYNQSEYANQSQGLIDYEVGLTHNRVISELYNDYGEQYLNELDDMELLKLLADKSVSIGLDVPVETVDFEQMLETTNIVNEILKSNDMEAAFKELKTLFPEQSQELDIIKIFSETGMYLETDNQMVDYATQFSAIVDNANINTASSSLLTGAVSVGSASFALWEVK